MTQKTIIHTYVNHRGFAKKSITPQLASILIKAPISRVEFVIKGEFVFKIILDTEISLSTAPISFIKKCP